MVGTRGQTRKWQLRASIDPENEETKESETQSGQGERARGDLTKEEEEQSKQAGKDTMTLNSEELKNQHEGERQNQEEIHEHHSQGDKGEQPKQS